MGSDNLKSDHYKNRREGVHYKILNNLPDIIRFNKPGFWYWNRVIMGNHSHFQCPPDNPCTYCEGYATYSHLDKIRYTLERWLP